MGSERVDRLGALLRLIAIMVGEVIERLLDRGVPRRGRRDGLTSGHDGLGMGSSQYGDRIRAKNRCKDNDYQDGCEEGPMRRLHDSLLRIAFSSSKSESGA